MHKSLIRLGLFCLFVLTTMLLWGCSAPTQPAQTPVVVTVVNTVEVEVTRMVQVPQTVEVTRQVVVTQLVPVTTTPSISTSAAPTATPTPPATVAPTLPAAAATVVWIPTKPPVKVNGISYLKITNATNDKVEVLFNGTVTRSYIVGGGTSVSTSIPWGSYTYQVVKNGKVAFSNEIRFNNSDKYEMVIFEDHAIINGP
jgi:hypothetical protein